MIKSFQFAEVSRRQRQLPGLLPRGAAAVLVLLAGGALGVVTADTVYAQWSRYHYAGDEQSAPVWGNWEWTTGAGCWSNNVPGNVHWFVASGWEDQAR
jgi:hypothetical protein